MRLVSLATLLTVLSTWAVGCSNARQLSSQDVDSHLAPTFNLRDTLTQEQERAIEIAKRTLPWLRRFVKPPPDLVGSGTDIFAKDVHDGWRIVFWKGWGDCLAGCINGRMCYVSVDTNGAVTIVGQFKREYDSGINAYRDSGVAILGPDEVAAMPDKRLRQTERPVTSVSGQRRRQAVPQLKRRRYAHRGESR